MKSIFDTLFRGSILMAPKYAVLIILFGYFAAIGEQNGLTKPVYTGIALVGVALGIAAVVYSAKQEAKEAEASNQK